MIVKLSNNQLGSWVSTIGHLWGLSLNSLQQFFILSQILVSLYVFQLPVFLNNNFVVFYIVWESFQGSEMYAIYIHIYMYMFTYIFTYRD